MNEPRFTSLETQLVRASLQNKSDGEIAALIEKPIEWITELIDQLTGGAAAARSDQIRKQREEQHAIDKKKNARKEFLEERRKRTERKILESKKLSNHLEKRKQQVAALQSNRKFATREVNMSQLISVRIDRKTHVFVKPGTDIEKVKQLYARKPMLKED
jgi:hypothetical protein